MPRIDDLPADRRAVLQLLLKQGKSYDDLASLLRIEPHTVRERARDALDRLGPAGTDLDMAEQDEIADYLLGQQTASQRTATRDLLETSPAGRAWARVVAGELRPLAGDALPEIPAERAERVERAEDADVAAVSGAPATRRVAHEGPARSSRLGGLLLLAAVGVAVALLIVFVLSGGDDGEEETTTGTTTTQQATTAAGAQQVLGQVNLNPVEDSPNPDALAAVTLVAQGGSTGMIFQGQKLPRNTRGNVYALWVINDRNAARLGFTPRVGKNGRLRFTGQIPDDVKLEDFTAMVLSRETTTDPKSPGTVIIAGSLPEQQ